MAISQRCLLLRKLSQLKSNIFKLTIIPGCNYRSVVCLHVTVFICALNTYRTVFSWTCASRQHPACENLAPAIYEKLSNSINKKLSYWYQVVLIIIYQSFCQTWHLECSSSHDSPSGRTWQQSAHHHMTVLLSNVTAECSSSHDSSSVERRVLIITWQSFWSNVTAECSSSHDSSSVERRVLIVTWQSFWSNVTAECSSSHDSPSGRT